MLTNFVKFYIREIFPLSIVGKLHIAKIISSIGKVWLPSFMREKYVMHKYFYLLNRSYNYFFCHDDNLILCRQLVVAGKYKKIKFLMDKLLANYLLLKISFIFGNYKICSYLLNVKKHCCITVLYTDNIECYELFFRVHNSWWSRYEILIGYNPKIINYILSKDNNFFKDVYLSKRKHLEVLQFLINYKIVFDHVTTAKIYIKKDFLIGIKLLFAKLKFENISKLIGQSHGVIYDYFFQEYIP